MSLPYLYNAFAALAADGNTAGLALRATLNSVSVYLGDAATEGGGTVKLQASFDGGTTYLDVPGSASFTAADPNAFKAAYTVPGNLMRFNLAGATNPDLDLCVKVEEVSNRDIRRFDFSADGSSEAFTVRDTSTLYWAAQGTWDGATMALEVSPDGGATWFKMDSATANAFKAVTTLTDVLCRFTMSSAGTTSLAVFLVE